MAEVTASLVKELREKTGAGMMDCKRALDDSAGDIEPWMLAPKSPTSTLRRVITVFSCAAQSAPEQERSTPFFESATASLASAA